MSRFDYPVSAHFYDGAGPAWSLWSYVGTPVVATTGVLFISRPLWSNLSNDALQLVAFVAFVGFVVLALVSHRAFKTYVEWLERYDQMLCTAVT